MYFIEDEYLAKHLHDELNCIENYRIQNETKEKENKNPVDAKLEYIDPTPSIHDLFVRFDKKFFWNSLGMVQVLWSSRMTKCAGICYFEGGHGLCKISLSAPLLSLRPRKDLVETLLHEMIHAYLFVTRNNKDREDHGPEFHKHMYRINKEAGTNITVYHSFIDEVEYYQRHIWRCDGPCRTKKPFFGFVRRAVNRAPGPYDYWWSKHKAECNGTFIKISEPEKPAKKPRKAKEKREKSKDIRNFFNKSTGEKSLFTEGNSNIQKTSSNVKTLSDLVTNKPVGGVKSNVGSATVVVTKKKGKISSSEKGKESDKSKSSSNRKAPKKSATPQVKTDTSQNVDQEKEGKEQNEKDPRDVVRNVWTAKFPSKSKPQSVKAVKKLKLECSDCGEGFAEGEIQTHRDTCSKLKSSSPKKEEPELKVCPVCSEKMLESEVGGHLEDCLKCSFANEEDLELDQEVECESVPCPCCYRWFLLQEINNHIDECLTLTALKRESEA